MENQLNILVIDDDDAMRRLIVDILTGHGHQTICASSAEEGLELLPVWTFHVAFLDHNLPGMEGLLLGEYLRRSNPDMTLALVTGSDDTRLERKTRDLHITFVSKPFEVADIVRVVDGYIEAASERDAKRRAAADVDFAPQLAAHIQDIDEHYSFPALPARVEGRLVEAIRSSMNHLRSAARYTERERILALSGLVTARVLGVSLPAASNGDSLYEEFDALMRERGRRPEFSPPQK